MTTLSLGRGEHDAAGGFKVFLVLQVVGVALFAVAFAGNGKTQGAGEVVERVAHVFHLHGFVVPGLDFGGVGFELLGKVGV